MKYAFINLKEFQGNVISIINKGFDLSLCTCNKSTSQ